MARKNVGTFAVGQLVRVHDSAESERFNQRVWRVVAFPSRRLVKLVSEDGGASALVSLLALRPVDHP